jgi:hypothetical protein
MKLHELKRGDRFIAKYYNEQTQDLVLEIAGQFLGMDGHHGKILLDGVSAVSYLDSMIDVEKLEEEG